MTLKPDSTTQVYATSEGSNGWHRANVVPPLDMPLHELPRDPALHERAPHPAEACDANWAALDAALCTRDAYPHPVGEIKRIETHISVIYLAGSYAYKLKRPVAFGEFDFRALTTRRCLCEDELRLNRRFSPQLYLAVVPVTHDGKRYAVDGEGATIDYLVKMARFEQRHLLSQRLAKGTLDAGTIDRTAAMLADFHCHADAQVPHERLGSYDLLKHQIETLCAATLAADADAAKIEHWLSDRLSTLALHVEARRARGFVRECHGDLHLDNLLANGEVSPFDCIEFSDTLRWLDVVNDIAFPVMDLWARGSRQMAFRLLNRWLEGTGDYRGLRALPLYFVYRALVRAWAMGAQGTSASCDKQALRERYLNAARQTCIPARPALLLCHGFSGSGKSLASDALAPQIGAVRLCADLERKRRAPLTAAALDALVPDAYTDVAVDANYHRLCALSMDILSAGLNLVVDGSFLRRRHRRVFIKMARSLDLPVWILDFQAPRAVLEHRVSTRTAEAARRGGLSSDADLLVLHRQIDDSDPLCGEEWELTLRFNADVPAAAWNTPAYWQTLVATLERGAVHGALT